MKEYTLRAYAHMYAASERTRAYATALESVVQPGDVVVSLGSGVGLFPLLACRAGASKVYAIEAGSVIEIARRVIAQNGQASRVDLIHANSLDVTLPDRADVLVGDLRGVLPLAGSALVSMFDARDRFLRPGGRVVPGADVIHAAVVSAPDTYAELVEVWDRRYGFDLSAAREMAANLTFGLIREDDVPLSPPAVWTTIDYACQQDVSVRGAVAHVVSTPGTAHGIALWFEAALASGVTLCSGPGSGDRVYGRGFLPWPEPVRLSRDDRVTTDLRADLIDGAYTWTWQTTVSGADGAREFRQSTFRAAPFPPMW